MGSRAFFVLHREADVAAGRFGSRGDGRGVICTRTGRWILLDGSTTEAVLDTLDREMHASGLSDEDASDKLEPGPDFRICEARPQASFVKDVRFGGGGLTAHVTPTEPFPQLSPCLPQASIAVQRTILTTGVELMRRRFAFPRCLPTAAVVLLATLGSMASAQERGGLPTLLGGPVLDLRVRLVVEPPDPPPDYNVCGPTSSLVAYTGESVRWCYRVTNNGAVALSRHDLHTGRFGTVLNNFPFTLAAGATTFLTRAEPVSQSLTETATWRAFNPGSIDDYTDTGAGTLTVLPGITLAVTLSIDPIPLPPNHNACGSQRVLSVPAGRTVRWCYRITNHSSVPRNRHTLDTVRAGLLLNAFPFTVAAGGSTFTTFTEPMGTARLTETASWTAFRPGPVNVSMATANARALLMSDMFVDGFE